MLNEINVQSSLIVRDLNSKGFNDDFVKRKNLE